MGEFIERILNLIFPPKCIFCQKLINFDTKLYICEDCKDNLDCKDRDKPLFKKVRNSYFDYIVCIFDYRDNVREAIKRFKFSNRSDYGKKFADIIYFYTKNMMNYENFAAMISVPSHINRLKLRGYNQSYLISKNLSKLLKIKEGSSYLKKVVNTKNQSDLSKNKRITNLEGAFKVMDDERFLNNKNIILVDDVFTTGSTVNECSKLLKVFGVKNIVVIIVASGNNFN